MAESDQGRIGDHIQINPPFIVGEPEISAIVHALDETLSSLTRTASVDPSGV
jgi:hypothetical protein